MPNQNPIHCVTFNGLPLAINMEWPAHSSGAGADYYVVHGTAMLADGSGLHADVAVHISQTVKEALPSLEPKDAEAPALNAIRKTADAKNIELLKSGKRQPVQLSSRAFNIISRNFEFQRASDADLPEQLKRKIYWLNKLGAAKVRVADPMDALYFGCSAEKLLQAAQSLASQGFITLDGEYAAAAGPLLNDGPRIEQIAKQALACLEAKHSFERA